MEQFPCEAYYGRIGSNIRKKRLERGLTQEGLAEASGLSLKMVQKLEAGQKGFRRETILRVAITLKVSLDSLSGMQEKERSRSFGQAMRYPLSSCGPWVVRHHACCCIRA